MKKVSILGLHLGIGGVENAIVSLANALSDNFDVSIVVSYKVIDKPIFNINKKVRVIYLSNYKPNREELKKSLKDKNIVGVIKEAFKSIKILYSRKNLIKKYIKGSNDDIIISTRILYNGILGKYAKNGTIKIAQEHRYHDEDKKYIRKLKKSCKNLDYFMPVSKYLTNFYKEEFKYLKPKIIYGPLCIDYYPKEYHISNNKRIISIGRLSPEKGFMDLVDVFKILYDKDNSWKLDIVGDGVLKDSLKDKINSYNLNDSIILHGFRDKEYIHKLLKDESIYVMCSYEESFGLVLIEAMAFGLPCIAFDSALGAKEIINNKNGLLIKNRNIQKMANKILEIYNDKKNRKLMSEEARKVSKNYGYESFKNFWIKFLENSSKMESK